MYTVIIKAEDNPMPSPYTKDIHYIVLEDEVKTIRRLLNILGIVYSMRKF